jgi:hypothetical protein
MAKIASSGAAFDPKKTVVYVERIEEVQSEIDEIRKQANEDCVPHYESIAAIKKEAAENDSIPRRELNSLISERKLEAKAAAVRTKLSDEQQHNFDLMKLALGDLKDTELGRAAMKSAGAPTAVTH